MAHFSNDAILGLPTITGDGIFPVKIVVPNAPPATGLFDPTVDHPSTSYSYPLMDPANLIGTATHPYMNIALPAYISTLYNNVFKINTNLTNNITATAADDRSYPTSHAVQHYVQSQVSGTQLINGTNNVNLVNTTTTTTLIQTAVTNAVNFEYIYDGQNNNQISIFHMNEVGNAESARNGASKTVMFSAESYLRNVDKTITGNLAFLYAGDKASFFWLGHQYKFYQFVATGDFIDFIQSYDTTTSSWDWLVKGCMGVFSNTVTLSNKAGGVAQISRTGANLTAPIPIGLDFK
jgi:hypothetical protein